MSMSMSTSMSVVMTVAEAMAMTVTLCACVPVMAHRDLEYVSVMSMNTFTIRKIGTMREQTFRRAQNSSV